MHINQSTIDLVKRFEGLKLKAYQDSVGVWTIGYGTTSRAGIGVQVRPGMTITEGQAADLSVLPSANHPRFDGTDLRIQPCRA